MSKVITERTPVQHQIDDFEKENPKIAEAMELFGMTMAKYQDALNATSITTRVYQSDSTVTKVDKKG